MGKLNMNLLKGVEEEQSAIDMTMTKNKQQDTQNKKSTPKQKQIIEDTPDEKKIEIQTSTKPQKQSFSFRADLRKIENWKLYADAVGTDDIGALWSDAIDEYIGNHGLTSEQQSIYDLKKQALEMQKKIIGKL